LLTILGIVIGIAAVITMTALIDGIKMSLVGQLGLNQSRLVYISCYPGTRQVTMDDLKQLELNVPDYEFVSAVSYSSGKVTNGTKSLDTAQLVGCDENYFTAVGSKLTSGRLLTAEECTGGAMSVVIDQQVVDKLWGSSDTDVVGQSIRINNDSYTIVGVIEASSFNGQMLYLPYPTLTTRVSGVASIDQIVGYAREDADMSTIADKTKTFLVKYYGISKEDQDYSVSVTTMKSIVDELDTTMASFQLLMTTVAGVSLVVGGIGIMNMMLTNVTERIREIGLRKALGARSSDITRQFLLESVTLCIVGGIFGILLGYGGAWALAGLASGVAGIGQIVPVISPTAVGMATGIC
ncbi:MAG: ABC transporter permease, partial [Olsenella sp.]